jgi:hypothetical protein
MISDTVLASKLDLGKALEQLMSTPPHPTVYMFTKGEGLYIRDTGAPVCDIRLCASFEPEPKWLDDKEQWSDGHRQETKDEFQLCQWSWSVSFSSG